MGAAVTSLKIKGAPHEFSSLPGVLEDVTDIVLNVKNLIVKLEGDEPKTMRLAAVGASSLRATSRAATGYRTPTFTSAKLAFSGTSATMRQSPQSATTMPPAMAWPFIAVTSGLGQP